MIWISSFPRSGNTFIRNILYDVYGIPSSTYHEEDYPMDEDYDKYIFVKTHILPNKVEPNKREIPAVYLVRDGRDALISLAHHKSNIIEPGTDFKVNLKEAILAAEGSYFGGWSTNVAEWTKRSSIIIYFEDLIKDPISQTERLRQIYPELPAPKVDNIPTFNSQKFGNPEYGSGKKIAKTDKEKEKKITKNWFRKGKINNWKDEFPEDLYDLFWCYHRGTMRRLGYTYNGEGMELNPDFDYDILNRTGYTLPKVKRKYKVVIEANKMLMHQNDGVKRYLSELLKALYPVVLNSNSQWQIDVFCNGELIALQDFKQELFNKDINENRKKEISFPRKIIHILKKTAKSIMPNKLHEKLAVLYRRILMKVRLKFTKGNIGHAISQVKPSQLDSYDLIHIPLPQHYEPFVNVNTKLLVTVHDLTHKLFSSYHTKRNIELSEKGLVFFNNKNAVFLAISKNTKIDLHQHYNIKDEEIFVVYEAADFSKFKPLFNKHFADIVKSYYKIPLNSPFILTVSTIEPRKNLLNTIKAFESLILENPELDVNLIICGRRGWKSRDVKNVKNKNRVIFTGFVDEKHLPVLYNEAMALCYVSYYEGFGLPLLEAMSCGTPIIYGSNSSMLELFNNFGLAANADNPNEIKDQMFKIITDKNCRDELSKKSLKRSFDFSWRETAEKTLAVYEELISHKTNSTTRKT